MARAVTSRLFLVLSAIAFFGCQQPSSTAPVLLGPLTIQLKAEGDALSERGHYEAAAVKYLAAVNQEPNDASLRFALGVAFSHLGRRAETVEQFRFVVFRGKSDAPEVHVARRWLISAGELSEHEMVTSSAASVNLEQGTSKAKTDPAAIQRAKVRVMTAPRSRSRDVNIVLAGNSDSNRELAFMKSVKLGESFEFENVPPGEYRLTAEDRETDTEVWNLQVTVASGKDLVLDLK